MAIFVETTIHGPIDEVWRLTQAPDLHVRWDLRFTDIEYEPRSDPSLPQRFVYRTRIGGISIEGHGETVGSKNDEHGERTSALRFWSDDPKSLIKEGAGYWKYAPIEGAVRFRTSYDYKVRYGTLGRLLDKLFFRPWMAWATAWSFDCLRLWIEKGIQPQLSLRLFVIHWLARLAVAFVWLYQGFVPKLYNANTDELAMLADAGISGKQALLALKVIGWIELGLAAALLATRHPARWFGITISLMAAATVAVAIMSPRYLTAAFNPISLNALVVIAASIGWLSSSNLPSAHNCKFSAFKANE
jgi:hypothetical protein